MYQRINELAVFPTFSGDHNVGIRTRSQISGTKSRSLNSCSDFSGSNLQRRRGRRARNRRKKNCRQSRERKQRHGYVLVLGAYRSNCSKFALSPPPPLNLKLILKFKIFINGSYWNSTYASTPGNYGVLLCFINGEICCSDLNLKG